MNNGNHNPDSVEVRIAQPDGSVKAFTLNPSQRGKVPVGLTELYHAQVRDRQQAQPTTYHVRYSPKGGDPEEYVVDLPRPVTTQGGCYLLIEAVSRKRGTA